MTGDLERHEGAEEYPQPRVAMMPPKPHGWKDMLDATELLGLGTELGAVGLEKSKSAKLMHLWQSNAVKVGLATLPAVMEIVTDISSARINLISQRIKDLQRIQMVPPATGVRGLLGMQQQLPAGAVYPEYVSLDQVLKILALAQVEPVHTPGS